MPRNISKKRRFKLKLPDYKPQFVLQAFSEVYDWGLLDLKIPDIHKHSLGSGIKIAIIDSGKCNHFDVSSNVVDAENFTNSPSVDDKAGHATAVAGIIAASKNEQGIIGVAPEAKLYFAKALDDGGTGDPQNLVKGVQWAMDKQVDIISISAGMFVDYKPLHKIIKKAYAQNITVIAAVGNTCKTYYDIAFPARYPEVIGVAAYGKDRHVAPFSSRGINVALSLPGVDVYTSWLNNQYVKISGSSFSAPILSGICALILAKHRNTADTKTPCETPKQMLEHLRKYAVKLDGQNETGMGTLNLIDMFKGD